MNSNFPRSPLEAQSAVTYSPAHVCSHLPFAQVHVKVSALFRVSQESYPYTDVEPMVASCLETFGADRMLWGTDFPFVVEQCGYKVRYEVHMHFAGF